MSESPNQIAMNDNDSGVIHPIIHVPTFRQSGSWFLVLYLAGVLLTNGLAKAVYHILDNII